MKRDDVPKAVWVVAYRAYVREAFVPTVACVTRAEAASDARRGMAIFGGSYRVVKYVLAPKSKRMVKP